MPAYRLPGAYQPKMMEKWEREDKDKPITVAHPKEIGYAATGCGAFWGSFFFIALLNIGTAYLVTHCVVAPDGTTSGICSSSPTLPLSAGQQGDHPDYLSNLLGLGVVA